MKRKIILFCLMIVFTWGTVYSMGWVGNNPTQPISEQEGSDVKDDSMEKPVIDSVSTPQKISITKEWLQTIKDTFLEQHDEMLEILSEKYGIEDYKKASQYKFRVCGAKFYNCYVESRYKYFVSYAKYIEKQGKFYFNLDYDELAFRLISSIAWCESGFKANLVSPDGGYGAFQVTPSAVGDKTIDVSRLLNPDYNTQQGVYILYKFWKSSFDLLPRSLKEYDETIRWQITLRGYNGGYKWIKRILDRCVEENDYQAFIETVVSGDFLNTSKCNGRFLCYERVNVSYPIKIYITEDWLLKLNITIGGF